MAEGAGSGLRVARWYTAGGVAGLLGATDSLGAGGRSRTGFTVGTSVGRGRGSRGAVSTLDGAALKEVTQFWHRLPAWPEVVDGLHRLKRGFMIAPLSNGHVALLVGMSKALGLPWDMVFGADLFRHYKPDPETYLGAAALFGCAPGEVLMVASHPSDLAGAARHRTERSRSAVNGRDADRAVGPA